MYDSPMAMPKPTDTVEVLIDELAVRLQRSNYLATNIRVSLTGSSPVQNGAAQSEPFGLVAKLDALCQFASDTNDVLYGAAVTLSANNG